MLRLELIEFFQSNPYAWETAEGLARKIGRDPEKVQEAIQRLLDLGIVATRPGASPRYRYEPPYRPAAGQVDYGHL